MRKTILFAAILAGCGGNTSSSGPPAGGAAAFNGHWQVATATLTLAQTADAGIRDGGVRDAGAATMTITRTSAPHSLRADYSFAATDATHGRLLGRLGVLRNDRLAMLSPMDGTVTIDGDQWIVATGASTAVFAGVLASESLTLTFDPADPRNVSPGEPPRALVMQRVAAPPAVTVGKWKALEMDLGGLTVHCDTCIRQHPGSIVLQVMVDIDSRHLMERTITVRAYSDGACTTLAKPPEVIEAKGLIEESAGALEIWSQRDEDSGDHVTWRLTTPAAGRIEITRTCAAMPRCEEEPSRMLLQKLN